MLDATSGLCQTDPITVPVSSNEETDAVLGISRIPHETSSKWGGARANSGGARPNCGGPQPGSGRPRKPAPATYATVEPLRWYCVRTEHGAEIAADMAIRTAGFTTLFPLMWVPPVAARRTADGRAIPARSERLVPLLPGYLMVRFDRTDDAWRRISTMRGVERIFSTSAERPTAVPDADISKLRQGLSPNGVLYPLAPPAQAANAKKRWVTMATGLLGLRANLEAAL